jgi:hypothetical protein
MSIRASTAVLSGSVACTVLASLLYLLLVWHTLRDTWLYEGWLFLAQLVLAGVGFVLGVVGLRRNPVVCVISVAVSGYILLIQLVL